MNYISVSTRTLSVCPPLFLFPLPISLTHRKRQTSAILFGANQIRRKFCLPCMGACLVARICDGAMQRESKTGEEGGERVAREAGREGDVKAIRSGVEITLKANTQACTGCTCIRAPSKPCIRAPTRTATLRHIGSYAFRNTQTRKYHYKGQPWRLVIINNSLMDAWRVCGAGGVRGS
jgi:hypothetical protein